MGVLGELTFAAFFEVLGALDFLLSGSLLFGRFRGVARLQIAGRHGSLQKLSGESLTLCTRHRAPLKDVTLS